MVAPVEKTTSSPYDRYSLARVREKVAVVWYGAKTFASLSTEQQTDLDETIDDAVDFIQAEAFGNEGFFRRTILAGITLIADQATYEMPSDAKELDVLTEVIGGETREVPWIDEHAYELLWSNAMTATHPLAGSQSSPRYTHRGFSTGNKLIIQRIPAPSAAEAGGKLFPLYRPFDGKMSQGETPILPPSGRRALLAYVKMEMARNNGDDKGVVLQESKLRWEINVLQKHEGRVTAEPSELGEDPTYWNEIQEP